MPLTSSMEDYIEAIQVIFQKQACVRCVDIAGHLSVTMPSVSRAIKELIHKMYLERTEDGTLILTDLGKQVASAIYERHCFFKERLLAAGVEPELAEKEACRMEHGISEESFQKLKDRAGNTNGKEM